MIALNILLRDRGRRAVVVHRDDLAGAEFRRRHGQHAGARADVEDAHAALDGRLELADAHGRRRMRARAESSAGIEVDDDVVGARLIVLPGRLDDDEAADFFRVEIRLPVVRPVLVLYRVPFNPARLCIEAIDLGEVLDALLKRAQAVVEVFVDRQIRLDRHDIRLLSLRQVGVIKKSTLDITVEFLWIFDDDTRSTDVVKDLRNEVGLLV